MFFLTFVYLVVPEISKAASSKKLYTEFRLTLPKATSAVIKEFSYAGSTLTLLKAAGNFMRKSVKNCVLKQL
jgi:hypothetical protein